MDYLDDWYEEEEKGPGKYAKPEEYDNYRNPVFFDDIIFEGDLNKLAIYKSSRWNAEDEDAMDAIEEWFDKLPDKEKRISMRRATGLRLKWLREEKGLTQLQLGEWLDLGRRTISKYERGQQAIPADDLRIICNLFDVSADYLLIRGPRGGSNGQKRFPFSEAALDSLGEVETAPRNTKVIDAVNYLLESGISSGLFQEVGNYIQMPYCLIESDFESAEAFQAFKRQISESKEFVVRPSTQNSPERVLCKLDCQAFGISRELSQLLDGYRRDKRMRKKLAQKFLAEHKKDMEKIEN